MPKRKLTPEAENRILRNAKGTDPALVSVECLHSTKSLLRKAGFLFPQPFHRYLVPIAYRPENPALLMVKPS